MKRFVVVPLALLLTGLQGAAAWAGDGDRQLALQARAVLKQYCHRCHGVAFEVEGLDVLDLKTLTADRGEDKPYLVPGHPEKSYLFERVAKGSMPPRKERERPSAEEKALLERWIKAGAPPFPTVEARRFLGTRAVLAAIHAHLLATPREARPWQRYFTLTHLHNNPGVAAADLRLVRAALSKAVNSLSWKVDVVVPRLVEGTEGTVLAVDVRDLGWDDDDLWREVLREYPYGLDYSHSRDGDLRAVAEDLKGQTDCDLPFVRADWFVATATRPPLYHTLLDLPTHACDLEKKLGVDVVANFRSGQVARAAFAASGVSAQNRLIERHGTSYGAYWKSYDFKARKPRNVLTRFPLGPNFADHPFPKQVFRHDGGEIIFNLPNGLQGYFLVDGQDRRIDEGPTSVVSDSQKTSGNAAIVTGTSCMSCHKHGMIPRKDTVRQGTAVGGDALLKVQELYRPDAEMQQLFRKDTDRFLRGLEQVVGPFLKVDEDRDRPIRDFPEPVGEVARTYLLTDLGPAEVAAELGLEKPDLLLDRIRNSRGLRELGLAPLTQGNTIKRDEWETREGNSLFQLAARELQLGAPINPR